MIIIGVDYHPSFQQIAFLDQETGECGERQLHHSDGEAEKFYRELQQRGVSVRVGMEATGYSRWFERLLAELGFEVWIGDAAEIKRLRVRKQKTDREDARLMRKLLLENRFPRIWVPSPENRDLRQLLWHRHRLVQMRTRIMNQLQAVAMNEGLRRKRALWSEAGRKQLESFLLAPWATRRRKDLLELMDRLNPTIRELTGAVEKEAENKPEVQLLMSHPGVGPLTALAGPRLALFRNTQINSVEYGLAWSLRRTWQTFRTIKCRAMKNLSSRRSKRRLHWKRPAIWRNRSVSGRKSVR